MDIKEQIEFKGLVMRSVPDDARELFKMIAKEEFDNHYGVALRSLILEAMEYRRLKEKFFNTDIHDIVKTFGVNEVLPREDISEETNERKDINGNKLNLWRK